MKSVTSILFMSLIDPLHNGAGEGLGLVDRPIARERPTGFPIIQPSSIKGVLRRSFGDKWPNPPEKYQVQALFGPSHGNAESHAGAVSFGEGQLLAFPIRSLRGLFVWATTPLILFRFARAVAIRANLDRGDYPAQLGLKDLVEKAGSWGPSAVRICEGAAVQLAVAQRLILEEFEYTFEESPEVTSFAKQLADVAYGPGSFLAGELAAKLVVLPHDSFSYFVKNATEVMPNISIGSSGTSEEGLRYTEYLPRESIMYSLISYEGALMPAKPADDLAKQFQALHGPGAVRTVFEEALPARIQIGGDETTGKGLVELRVY